MEFKQGDMIVSKKGGSLEGGLIVSLEPSDITFAGSRFPTYRAEVLWLGGVKPEYALIDSVDWKRVGA
jgi:hypothetical protein